MAFYSKEETAKHKQDFLDNYLNYGSIVHTLKAIGLSSGNTVKEWKARDPEFLVKYLEAKERKADVLEGLAFQIARGDMKVNVPQCTMIIFQLKALKPDVYTDKAQYEVIVKSSQQKALERVERLAGLYNKPKAIEDKEDDPLKEIGRHSYDDIDAKGYISNSIYNKSIRVEDSSNGLEDTISVEPVPVKKDIPLLSTTIPNIT